MMTETQKTEIGFWKNRGSSFRVFVRSTAVMKMVAPVLFFLLFIEASLQSNLSGLSIFLEIFNHLIKWGTPLALLAIGTSLVLATGGVDISIAGVATLSGIFFAILTYSGMPLWACGLFTLIPGMLTGLFLGWVVARYHASPLIASWSVGMLSWLISVTLVYWLYNGLLGEPLGSVASFPLKEHGMYGGWNFSGKIFYMAIGLLIFIVIILSKSHLPKRLCAVGANKVSATYLGINVYRTVVSAYILSGCCASLAGVFWVLRNNSAATGDIMGNELIAVAIAVLGGTAMSGGYLYLTSIIFAAMFWAEARLVVTNLNLTFLADQALQQRFVDAVFALILIIVSAVFGKMLSGTADTILTEKRIKEE